MRRRVRARYPILANPCRLHCLESGPQCCWLAATETRAIAALPRVTIHHPSSSNAGGLLLWANKRMFHQTSLCKRNQNSSILTTAKGLSHPGPTTRTGPVLPTTCPATLAPRHGQARTQAKAEFYPFLRLACENTQPPLNAHEQQGFETRNLTYKLGEMTARPTGGCAAYQHS